MTVTEGAMHPSITLAHHLMVRRTLLARLAAPRHLVDLHRLALLRPRRRPQMGTTMAERGATTETPPRKPMMLNSLRFPKVVSGEPGEPTPSMPSSLPLGGMMRWLKNGS